MSSQVSSQQGTLHQPANLPHFQVISPPIDLHKLHSIHSLVVSLSLGKMETNQAAKQMHIMVLKEIKYVRMSWQKQKNIGSPLFFCKSVPIIQGTKEWDTFKFPLPNPERLLWPLHSNILFPMTWDQLRPNSDRLQLYLRIFSVSKWEQMD